LRLGEAEFGLNWLNDRRRIQSKRLHNIEGRIDFRK